MHRKSTWLVVLVCLSVAAAPAAAGDAGGREDEMAEVRSAIEAGNARWIEAFRNSDAELLASVFDEHGAILSSSGDRIDGREAIREWMGAVMARFGPAETTIETLNVWVEGDLAYETGGYSYTFRPGTEEERVAAGSYVVVWKRQADGSWKIFRDIGLPD